MTVQEQATVLKNCAFMLEDGIKYMKEGHKKQFKKAYEGAMRSLEAWEKVNEDIDRLARRPCINQNMMAQNIAYKEVKDIIKKHLREVEE